MAGVSAVYMTERQWDRIETVLRKQGTKRDAQLADRLRSERDRADRAQSEYDLWGLR